MGVPEKEQVTLGFIPLADCAPLIVADAKGFFARAGIDVRLSREASWANIRDKVAVGALDGAQMLGPLPIAATLGLSGLKTAMVTALSLSLGGNAITVARPLVSGLSGSDGSLAGLRALGARLGRARPLPLTFAVPFPFSSHTYLLRHWLAAVGLEVGPDVRIISVPPSRMAGQLAAGNIHGYCVGEPWNAQAVLARTGEIVATSRSLWNNHPEKVFGVTEEWAAANPRTHRALLCALIEACRWADAPQNRRELFELLEEPVGASAEVLARSFSGVSAGSPVFFRAAATFPWQSQAMWWVAEMQRWGQLADAVDLGAVARRTYRTDLYRAAARDLGINVPTADAKREGGHAEAWPLSAVGPTMLTSADGIIAMEADLMLGADVLDPANPTAYLARRPPATLSHAVAR